MKFKDYEYGWYGIMTTYQTKFMGSGSNHNYIHGYDGKPRELYDKATINVFKQLPKLKGVIFIYGDYRDI